MKSRKHEDVEDNHWYICPRDKTCILRAKTSLFRPTMESLAMEKLFLVDIINIIEFADDFHHKKLEETEALLQKRERQIRRLIGGSTSTSDSIDEPTYDKYVII